MPRSADATLALAALLAVLLAKSAWDAAHPGAAPETKLREARAGGRLAGNEVDVDLPSCFAHCIERNRNVLPIDVSLPLCTTESWCRTNYSREKIAEVCGLFCRNQFPPDCATAKYFVLLGSRPWGLGSDFHQRMVGFAYALSTNRVLIYDDSKSRSLWTSPDDSFARCASGHFDCYFQPITNCTKLPSGWFDHIKRFGHAGVNEQLANYQFVGHDLLNDRIADFTEFTRPRVNALHLSNTSILWWKAQMMGFLFRPNDYILASSILPKVSATFPNKISAKFISVFLRGGDKALEAALHDPTEYWDVVQRLSRQMNISDIYVSSDSGQMLNQTLNLASALPNVRLFYLDYDRLPQGMDMVHLRQIWRTPGIRSLVGVALTDLYIASRASAWVGTLSSNWCRLIDESRLSNGRYGVKYHSLDGQWVGLTQVRDRG